MGSCQNYKQSSFSTFLLRLPNLKCILYSQKFIDFIISSFVSPPKKIGNGIVVSGRFPQLPSEGTFSEIFYGALFLVTLAVVIQLSWSIIHSH